jgi:glycosyltransferase involved in cell wall biosynthesis
VIRSITFTLPGSGRKPVGGYKVVYEYANHLSRRGLEVAVVHPARLFAKGAPLKDWLRLLRYVPCLIDKGYRPDRWFGVESKVRVLWVPSLSQRYIPEADAVVATTWQTAEWVDTYKPEKGKKIYLVQDYEHYMTADAEIKERIRRTFRSGLKTLCISPAVTSMVREAGGSIVAEIPNGLDFAIYFRSRSADDPDRDMVGFPARTEKFKGMADTLQALKKVIDSYPRMKVWAFGPKPVRGLPEWVCFYLRPSDNQLRELYNRTKIFVTASYYEGWGLPGAEAMACGAALVSTDHGGVRAYASHGETALLSPAGEPEALVENIFRLVQDEALRIRIAEAGHDHIRKFTWGRAVNQFLRAINES